MTIRSRISDYHKPMTKFINPHRVCISLGMNVLYVCLCVSDRERDHEIAAAVGYCSHFVLIISQFIQLPLRFPIDYQGISAIKIYDYGLESSE